jgi:hypothetical protein
MRGLNFFIKKNPVLKHQHRITDFYNGSAVYSFAWSRLITVSRAFFAWFTGMQGADN